MIATRFLHIKYSLNKTKILTFYKKIKYGHVATFGTSLSLTGLVCLCSSYDIDRLSTWLKTAFKKGLIAHCKDKTNEFKAIQKNETKTKSAFDWKTFLRFLKKEKFLLILAIASAFIAALLNIYIPQNLGYLINNVYKLLKENSQDYFKFIYVPSIRLIKLYATQSMLTFVYIYVLGIIGENMATNMKKELFANLIRQDISFYDNARSGELIDTLTNDIQEFKSSFKQCISQGLKSLTQIIGSCVSLYMISSKLTLLTALIVPLLVTCGSLFGSLLREYSKQAQLQVSKATCVADEAINNVRTVRAFAMENIEIKVFNDELDRAKELNIKLAFGVGLFQGMTNLFINSLVLGVIYGGGYMLINNEINAGQLMSYLTATQIIQRSFTQLSILFGQTLRGLTSGTRVFEFLKLRSIIPVDDLGIKIDNLEGNIQFVNVSFSYPNRREQLILSNFNLNIKNNQTIAIVGNSGSGKSTVCALLERFYDVDSGDIRIDGVSIRELSTMWLRKYAIGYISQEPILFNTSIAENIRYGRPEASDAQVREAARLANAHDFIQSFPLKYDTLVGERGTSLSGGQKQRIAISRALLKNPKILIFDEATSALDAQSERQVQETINGIIGNRTVIIIAHRLSTIKQADLIVVMQNGCIIEVGTHEQLLNKRGHYFNLFKLQTSATN